MKTTANAGPRCADRSIVPDPDLFFPVATTGPDVEAQIEEAKQVCDACPIRRECLEVALRGGPSTAHGTWGGLTEDERRHTRRRRARSAA
uniref:WhiB family transcriptional regulator n=1 Tax=Streptosporangium sp. CA-235898 TaxID=3240073 RepID=UPI003F49A26B